MRLTTSSQVGSKVFGCVVYRFHVAASKQSLDEAPYINCLLLSQTSKHHLQSSLSLLSWSILNLGFLTEGKLAAILIIPSSWGSQRAGHSPRIKLIFWRRCRGREKTSARGVLRTHILYFVLLFCFTLFILPALLFIKNPKKLESLVVVISLL